MGTHDQQKRLGLMKPLVDKWAIDSRIRIDYSPSKGIYVVANRDLSEYKKVVRVLERYIMSVNDNFPFKETYIEALSQTLHGMSILRNPLDPIVETMIQICQILINLNRNRQEIEQALDGYNDLEPYVENGSLRRNYLYSMSDTGVSDTPVIWDKQDNEYGEEIVNWSPDQSFTSDIYDELLVALKKMKTPKATFLREKVIISKEQFLWAHMIINTKAFALSYKKYLVVSQNKPKENTKNHQLNLKYFTREGVFMLPVADFVNQIHPKKEDLSDVINYSMDYERGYIELSASGNFKAGEEYGFLYSQHLSSLSLVATHGYAIEDNILEEVVFSIRNLFLYLRPS